MNTTVDLINRTIKKKNKEIADRLLCLCKMCEDEDDIKPSYESFSNFIDFCFLYPDFERPMITLSLGGFIICNWKNEDINVSLYCIFVENSSVRCEAVFEKGKYIKSKICEVNQLPGIIEEYLEREKS